MINRTAVRMGRYWAVVQWKEGDKAKTEGVEVRAADPVGAAQAAIMVLEIDLATAYAIDIWPSKPQPGPTPDPRV